MSFLSPIVIVLGLLVTGLHQGASQCPEPNSRAPLGNQCDAYIECRDGQARELLCPDGLVFNEKKTKLNRYPCDYPVEVDCGSRSQLQPANPSEHCPHRFGLNRHEETANCGQFWNCVDGRPFLYNCPEGLAFSVNTLRCEYPDEAPGCDPEAYLGFRCPTPDPVLMELFLNNPRYPHPSDCRKFYVCLNGVTPRLQHCQGGFGFNAEMNVCDKIENVPGCSRQ